jgi:hypothetical protein
MQIEKAEFRRVEESICENYTNGVEGGALVIIENRFHQRG